MFPSYFSFILSLYFLFFPSSLSSLSSSSFLLPSASPALCSRHRLLAAALPRAATCARRRRWGSYRRMHPPTPLGDPRATCVRRHRSGSHRRMRPPIIRARGSESNALPYARPATALAFFEVDCSR